MNEIRQAYFRSEFKTREDAGQLLLEGYFVVYNQRVELWPGFFEEILPGACASSLSNNIIALFNHNSDMVLGATKSGTLKLTDDAHGLYGSIAINSDDSDAMNVYQRVKRGDIQGCSFGFRIQSEKMEYLDDGTIISRLEEVNVHEVSICPFPAYPQTSIQARRLAFEEQQRMVLDAKKAELRRRLTHA